MSLNIQKCLRERRLYGNIKCPNSKRHKQDPFDEQIYSDKFIMSHMTLEKELEGHTGCVNTLDWSLAGDKLLTGSDDEKLNIYHTFEDYKLVETIETGHSANIFTAKFMPQTSDAIIISGAGDSELRIFDLQADQKLDSMYVCHRDQIKKVCVYHDNPFEFLTCSQDGTVRHFDRRVPHLCPPHNVQSFMGIGTRLVRQVILPKCDDLHQGCSRPIVDYSKYNIELNCMSINQLQPHYFAIAGMSDYIYLHDKRMLPSQSQHQSTNADTMDSLKCVKRFSLTLDGVNRPNKHVTACRFSDANGYELLGSWSSDGIYLFNINDDPAESSARTTTVDSTPTTTLSPTQQKKLQWQRLLRQLESHQLDRCLDTTNFFPIDDNDSLGRACMALIHVACTSNRRYDRDAWYQGSDEAWHRYFFDHELVNMQEKLQEAEEAAATAGWQGNWCLAVGYWLLRGGVNPIPQVNRSGYLLRAQQELHTAIHAANDQNQVYIKMMERLWRVLESENVRALSEDQEMEDDDGDYNDDDKDIWKWAQLMYISLYSVDDIRTLLNITVSNTTSHNDDDDLTLYTRIMSRQIMDIYRRSRNNSNENDNDDNSSDLDLDLEEFDVFGESTNLQNFETDVGVVKPRMKYTGHRNIETVKDVDFYGAHDEYIVSGSDGGYLFIWDKKSGQIVQILQADGEIVNIAKGHPYLPILAVSGIDNTTKIFTPTSRNPTTSRILEPTNPSSYSTSSVMHNQQAIISGNLESNLHADSDIYITRSMIEALASISRAHRRRALGITTMNGQEENSNQSDNTELHSSPNRVYQTDESTLSTQDSISSNNNSSGSGSSGSSEEEE